MNDTTTGQDRMEAEESRTNGAGSAAQPVSVGAEEIEDDEVLRVLVYPEYPENADDGSSYDVEAEIEALVAGARDRLQETSVEEAAAGRVSNAGNAASGSDSFSFWTPAEENALGIGSLVRHAAPDPVDGHTVDTYAIITGSEAKTLGLDDYAIDVYEQNGRPPLATINPTASRRRPIFSHKAKVIASNAARQRPVLSGPVFAVRADELAALHNRQQKDWPGRDFLLLGFYEDDRGEYGVFAEERARVLGPKQGHVILSGMPGAGKTSLFLSSVISLYAQLRQLEPEAGRGNGGGPDTQIGADLAGEATGEATGIEETIGSGELEGGGRNG